MELPAAGAARLGRLRAGAGEGGPGGGPGGEAEHFPLILSGGVHSDELDPRSEGCAEADSDGISLADSIY